MVGFMLAVAWVVRAMRGGPAPALEQRSGPSKPWPPLPLRPEEAAVAASGAAPIATSTDDDQPITPAVEAELAPGRAVESEGDDRRDEAGIALVAETTEAGLTEAEAAVPVDDSEHDIETSHDGDPIEPDVTGSTSADPDGADIKAPDDRDPGEPDVTGSASPDQGGADIKAADDRDPGEPEVTGAADGATDRAGVEGSAGGDPGEPEIRVPDYIGSEPAPFDAHTGDPETTGPAAADAHTGDPGTTDPAATDPGRPEATASADADQGEAEIRVPDYIDQVKDGAEVDAGPTEALWVAPIDGVCPVTHPVKAKLASGIYHAPGGMNYVRTRPDRCYVSIEAAEADGLRSPKR